MSARVTYFIEAVCFMTPSELRQIADEMELAWANNLPGRTTEVYRKLGERCVVSFCIEQEGMSRECGPLGKGLPPVFPEEADR